MLNLAPELRRMFQRIDGRLDALERRRLPLAKQLGPTASAVPFKVVDSTGIGDFTSLQSAITAAGTTTSYLYVRSFTESAATRMVLPTDADITIFGDPTSAGQIAFAGITGGGSGARFTIKDLALNIGGVGATLADDSFSGFLFLIHSQIRGSSSPALLSTSSTAILYAESCRLQGFIAFGGSTSLQATLINCTAFVGENGISLWSGTYTNPVTLVVRNSQVTYGAATFNSTTVPGNVIELTNNVISGGATVTFKYYTDSGGNHGGSTYIISGNRFINAVSGTWNFAFGSASSLVFSNNVVKGITVLGNTFPVYDRFAISTTGKGNIEMIGNYLPQTDVTIGAVSVDSRVHIAGIYQSVTLACNGALLDVLFNAASAGGFIGTFLTVSGDANMVNASFRGTGGATKAYALTGNTNMVRGTGAASCTTASTDTGVGNIVQVI